ncbi:MAG TPA: prolipoprotein diacylglyceryl transferase family protein [Flavisolibacter sp.]|nr:prolipoprotein diacylglyceryl transferase family protein [Flavisolibacter sp.]
MHFPIELHIGSFTITLHAVMETLAFFIGFRYFLFLRKKQGDHYASSSRIWVIVGAIFGALIGSRLIGALERPYELSLTDNLLGYIYNNKTVVGGFLGGLLGVETVKKIIGEKRASGDLFVYPMILALIIGRIGCFSMGVHEEVYGAESSMPWAMNLGDGLRRHPAVLYEILFLLLLWASLRNLQRRTVLETGALFKAFMISYLFFRFLADFIKPHYPVFSGLSTIQLSCLAGLFYYLPFILHPKKLIATYA